LIVSEWDLLRRQQDGADGDERVGQAMNVAYDAKNRVISPAFGHHANSNVTAILTRARRRTTWGPAEQD
jgi:hypothetical protein